MKMGGNESYGRPASFLMGLAPSKYPPGNSKNGFPLDISGWVLEGRKISKKSGFQKCPGVFSQVGKVRNSIFSLSLNLRWDGGMGFPALAPNGYEF